MRLSDKHMEPLRKCLHESQRMKDKVCRFGDKERKIDKCTKSYNKEICTEHRRRASCIGIRINQSREGALELEEYGDTLKGT